jgi:hypothetical protein
MQRNGDGSPSGVGEVVETMVLEGLELAVSDIFQGV